MNKWMAVMVILLLTGMLAADGVAGSVRGYYRHDGTYVQPHHRTPPGGPLFNHDRFPGMTTRTLASAPQGIHGARLRGLARIRSPFT